MLVNYPQFFLRAELARSISLWRGTLPCQPPLIGSHGRSCLLFQVYHTSSQTQGTRTNFFPSGQRTRGSSGSPALLKRSEIGLALVTEPKACQLLPLCGGSLATELSPAGAIEPGGLLDQLLAPGRILFPPLVVGHRAPVAQQIVVPVLATADAAVARASAHGCLVPSHCWCAGSPPGRSTAPGWAAGW